MINSEDKFTSEIKINNEPLTIVDTFKYLGESWMIKDQRPKYNLEQDMR